MIGLVSKMDTYVYFALKGDDFDPQIITQALDIFPTHSWRKGDAGRYNPSLSYSAWEWATKKGKEYFWVERLVEEVVDRFYPKIAQINRLKQQYNLHSVLEIVLYIDENESVSTPALGHQARTIEFLYLTQTTTDVDIYLFDSSETI